MGERRETAIPWSTIDVLFTSTLLSGWFCGVPLGKDIASVFTVSPSEARLGLRLAPFMPLVDCRTGGGGGICGGDDCDGGGFDMLATNGVAGGRIPPLEEILCCGWDIPGGGCIFFIWVCTDIGVPLGIFEPTATPPP